MIFSVWNGQRLVGFLVTSLDYFSFFCLRRVFFWNFLKTSQSQTIYESSIQMGQYLSLPFILAGFILIWFNAKWQLFKGYGRLKMA